MPFIDTTAATFSPKVTESDLQARLGDLLATAGWSVAANFKKVIFDASLTNPRSTKTPSNVYRITVAEHFIYANQENKMFGIAITGSWSPKLLEYKFRPDKDAIADFADWTTNEFRKYRSPQTLFVYMVEDLKGLTLNYSDVVLAWDTSLEKEQLRAAVDIEVESSKWSDSGSSNVVFTIDKAEGGRMQSPVMQAGLRTNLLEKYFEPSYNSAVQFTNWWADSEISIKGTLSKTNAFFVMQCDNVPAPEGNLVPSIPFYFGKLDPIEEGDNAYALFVGSVPIEKNLKDITEYDYDNTATRQPNIMPLLKSYPKFPANGLDNVCVHRGKLGARYQAHYLSWNAPPNQMPPERSSVDGKRDYPRAWNNAENPLYKYNFNPSRYSSKVHTSKVYVIHPEEGVRGTLKDTIALAAFSFHANKLRVKKAHCPDEFDVYRYFMVEGVSPLTKKPGTQFRPAGIGLYLNTVDKEGKEIPTP
ncbi:hypothetical protein O0555_03720 [Brevibacillus laterosporus]|uniref:hypothetical protein n=1 Tax=Brevibacillus laterosporus TaxID=1465 RepID=UPI00037D4BD9|nr:hypothetical protein [Brevibacillus laterosporus]ATO51381.1 hypothetical protein BrL25_21140 [Brevibacillus laterosporus DSM 25]MBG9801199.1 hypothetical protein [Brevibacillus laterosporus]MCR8936461.1 hypothetical protein [Brevibacillus laterosporus]MCZ0839100.1 hypothetical protein [Brevibacillus laterosporus]MCZ0846361.1 hypothetical protein [Brevibacillus laterosporus]